VTAGLVVFVVRPLTPGVIFGTLLGAVLALFLVDVLRHPAAEATEAAKKAAATGPAETAEAAAVEAAKPAKPEPSHERTE